MSHIHHRRQFLKTTSSLFGALGAAPAIWAQGSKSPNSKVNVAIIGVDGRGRANLIGVRDAGANVVALCDIDASRIKQAKTEHPQADVFNDFRKVFEKPTAYDAVVISTPDHNHAFPTATALKLGKHVYCEKPLTHTVSEARIVRQLATEKKLVTQMGTQIHAGANYRRVVEIVQSGGLGEIKNVKVWCDNRPSPGKKLGPKATTSFDSELWLGPVPGDLFSASHAGNHAWPHYNWRYWWEFGGGSLADFGCHFSDLPFWALNLTSPTRIVAKGSKSHAGDNPVPDMQHVEYDYPANGKRAALKLTWTNGSAGPDLSGKQTYRSYPSGVLFEGEKGCLVADYNKYTILPGAFAKDFQVPEKSIPDSVGHHKEWINAIRNGTPTTCPFSYSGLLTEAVLLGNVAYRAGEELLWDGKTGRVTNTTAANQYLSKEYRKGWALT